MKRVLPFFFVAIGMLVATPAFAQDPLSLKIGVGLKGGLNGSLVSGVPEDDVWTFEGREYIFDPNVFPMFGLGGGVGPSLEIRVMDLIGLETGLQLSYDNGSGFQDINDPFGRKILTVNQDQKTTALHIPLLIKIVAPGAFVRPAFGLGAEFVLQQSTELTQDPPNAYSNPRTAETSSYVLGMLTAGLEFNVGVVRIPLELRLGYNLGFGSKATDRARLEGNNVQTATVVYDGEYQGHFMLYTGIVYDYELLL